MTFGSFYLSAWEIFLAGTNFIFDLYQGHMIKNHFYLNFILTNFLKKYKVKKQKFDKRFPHIQV